MIPSIPQPRAFRIAYGAYVTAFFLYLVVPLVVVAAFAFNDSLFPSLPWKGFTLDWFFNDRQPRLGLFHDRALLRSIGVSAFVAVWVSVLSVAVGTCNAFLFERHTFPMRDLLYVLMLAPLVIPGVILGISILVFSNSIINAVDAVSGIEIDALRPGLLLVVLGQFAFLTTITTLVDLGPPSQVRRFPGRGGDQPGSEPADRRLDGHHPLSQAGPGGRRHRRVPDVVRELQHDAHARRLGRAARPSPCTTASAKARRRCSTRCRCC